MLQRQFGEHAVGLQDEESHIGEIVIIDFHTQTITVNAHQVKVRSWSIAGLLH